MQISSEASGPPNQPNEPLHAPPEEHQESASKLRGLALIGEWLWQGQALSKAKHRVATSTPRQQLLIEQARSVFDLGERVRDRVTSVTAESSDATALILFHQAGTLALEAVSDGLQRGAAWEAKKDNVLRLSKLNESEVSRLESLFPGSLPAMPLPDGQGKQDADILQRTIGTLVSEVEAPHRRAEILRGVRFFRMTLLILALLGATWGSVLLVKVLTRGPNLLEGKAWQASSTYPGLDVARGVCDGRETKIFFHTQKEANPWVQFDIGQVAHVQRIEVRNRTDAVGHRALPLVLELSVDGRAWKEVARRSEDFRTWEVDFEPMPARYLRARAHSTTWLHLEWVKAR